jgi:prephenate dehydrogenase
VKRRRHFGWQVEVLESTSTMAKSSPAIWANIYTKTARVLDVLNEHISQLRKFKACLEKN